MKLMGLLAMVCLAAPGGEPITMTFTNGSQVVTNAEVIAVRHSLLIYKAPDGSGSIKLKDLPPELRAKLGYNEEQAAAEEKRASAIAQSYRQADAATAAARFEAKARAEVQASYEIIWGKVIQRTGEKMLVSAGDQEDAKSPLHKSSGLAIHQMAAKYGLPKEWQAGVPKTWERAYGTVMLLDHPAVSSVADGDIVLLEAWLIGNYEYTTVTGAKSTVRKYTGSFDRALAAYKAGSN